ncbi:MAG: PilZ domain-containing protein, partial [Rhodospirillales bacterium]|nr:PilZ domain-containing protein [Rhodospirillales bacterium]
GERKGRATIENISPGGAQITTRVPVEPGQAIVLTIGDLGTANGHVAWTNRYTVGVKFDQEVDAIADLLLSVAIY